MTTADGQTPDGLEVLKARLAQLNDFRATAQQELAEQGGIDPELVMEIRKLDEAIRGVNLLIFKARGRKVTRAAAKRERCATCKRVLPAGSETDGE